MKMETEGEVQRLIDIELILIIIAIGADILIQALSVSDWGAAAVIIAGFCIMAGLYWHKLHMDRLFGDFRQAMYHLFHTNAPTTTTPPIIPLPASSGRAAPDVPIASIADRPLIHVSNFLMSKNFYQQSLGMLGYRLTMDFPALAMAAFGIGPNADLWIKGDGVEQKIRAAFSADRKAMVDDFFDAALNAGGSIAEAPGTRPVRGTGYYAAAVFDPDGYTIEAFYHDASAQSDIIDEAA